eukprot:CAMPEP_0195131576 /NCGR_PEP_ID=MMETSP0448-20130528/145348_1 /TAXON_ID=66468 /ORGANISM="Heterocapsa triquestra, Strain CCMP 448" /LENGTH=107 /DNA_ID=CAMNT_0040169537 /DNA_START=15 /DNA_END=335 /DNA_ORIENTATION=+
MFVAALAAAAARPSLVALAMRVAAVTMARVRPAAAEQGVLDVRLGHLAHGLGDLVDPVSGLRLLHSEVGEDGLHRRAPVLLAPHLAEGPVRAPALRLQDLVGPLLDL